MALRMPAYHRMGEAAYDLLLVRGANLTPRHVLERLALSAEEQQQVYADCAIPAAVYNAYPDISQQACLFQISHSSGFGCL